MSLLDLVARIELIKQELESTREEESVRIANDMFSVTRLRIQQEREDSTGSKFGNYSVALVPRWYGEAKALSAGAKQRIRGGDYFQSYKDFREADGLQTEALDFTRTGQMFQQSGVTEIENTTNTTIVKIGGQTEYAKRILGYHNERFGNILQPNEEEVQLVVDAQRERIEELISRFL